MFLAVAFVTASAEDWPFGGGALRNVRNLSGPFGSLLAFLGFRLFGPVFAWLVPMALMVLAGGVVAGRMSVATRGVLKGLVLVILAGGFLSLIPPFRDSHALAGTVGAAIGAAVSAVLGEVGGTILLTTLILLMLRVEMRRLGAIGRMIMRVATWMRTTIGRWRESAEQYVQRRAEQRRQRRFREAEMAIAEPAPPERVPAVENLPESGMEPPADDLPWMAEDFTAPEAAPRSGSATVAKTRRPSPRRERVSEQKSGVPLEDCELPSMSILDPGARASTSYSGDQLKMWSDVLEGKLSNYGVEGRVTAVNQGPLVTTFEFEPAPGVKIRDITSRADDLALAMRARSLRLIAPIPGRAVVGIEIPNPEADIVFLRNILAEIPERLRLAGIMIALGMDAIGKPFHVNLCSAPHLLMAGTTGSGKSVALNCILASILFQYRPADVRMLLIDPKMVEMSMYNGIPHLLHPVITEPREAVRIFNYLIGEMGRRNRLLRKHGVKNIESFNSKIAMGKADPEDDAVERLPYIVLVVDELGDLVLTKGADFESLLSRLSNMARAVGIHMIVATQRPSVDVIVGKTKANFPTRIAFRVATKVDSRTILDIVGAEKLLGRGDMLYVDAKHPEALRLHGAWITEDELGKLVDHWKQYEFEEAHLDFDEGGAGPVANGDKDAFFDDARDVILQYRQGSTSLLQRKLHVGYARAARLLDQLEQAGIVGPPDGSKPREVLVRDAEEEESLGA
jgi:S-DNA-T family DNA segregation ATPase FtsK/SpoIIIE